ncbi:malto-oligosyltrehalose trehalohydrolase [Methylococcus sp. EFPC2]|nr:malto-oligosyltrehalose trehalohydrolase [Methylococcus sp. EFPC2]
MPFGAEVLPDGRVRFRLWAPEAQRVDLCLVDRNPEAIISMASEAEGWRQVTTDQATRDTAYLFRIDGGHRVPDPASRFQLEDVHGSSRVVDPAAFAWSDDGWRGRPWEETVFYELHVGTFTSEGTFQATSRRLDRLHQLGVTAIQLMPVAEFPGRRNWGYDGALKFAVESAYGGPDDLKELVQTAHELGLMVFLDAVYNHFGPEGNYLHLYVPAFFSREPRTPWGDAINFDGEGSHWVRSFFVHNALYWLEEYHLDGLRLDAVHAIHDDSQPGIVEEIADAVRQRIGGNRTVHLVLENDDNIAAYLERDESGCARRYQAQWNDDIHHALHVLLTGEAGGYYRDYSDRPMDQLGRCLSEGFAYQGEPSPHRNGNRRGEPSRHLPPTAFVSFLQNHDQIGNRAFGERITQLASAESVRAAMAILLLAPSPPLLFMGQEWGSRQPFAFFCHFEPALAEQVTEGRRREFAGLPQFRDPVSLDSIPDPSAEETFRDSTLDWQTAETTEGRQWLAWHRELLSLRRLEIVPRLAGIRGNAADFRAFGERSLLVRWLLGDDSQLVLLANLGPDATPAIEWPEGRLLFALPEALATPSPLLGLPGWSVAWFIREVPDT